MVLGLIVGIPGAQASARARGSLRGLVQGYVEAIRNTPFLVQLLLIYLGLPSRWGSACSRPGRPSWAFVNLGAYATEIVHAGIETIPSGQIEAGRALRLTR